MHKAPRYDNLKLGIPAMTDVVIDRRGYALGYSEKHEQPLWVTYRLSAAEADGGGGETQRRLPDRSLYFNRVRAGGGLCRERL